MTFLLANIRYNGAPTPIIRVGDTCFALADLDHALVGGRPQQGLLHVFETWPASEPILLAAADRIASGAVNLAPLTQNLTPDDFLAPILYPRKIACMGGNYYAHMHGDAKAMDYDKAKSYPPLFIKPASTTLVGAGKSVRYPSQSVQFDWEVELCAIVGKRARKVKAGDADGVVAAYTIGIDLSARDWQLNPAHPFKFDLFGGKAFDDSCTLGPWVVPARFVDAKNLNIRLFLNDDLKQSANTRDMIWSVEEIIELMSNHVTLEPADVIMTGTPAGVGMSTKTFMKVGDKLRAEIDHIGTLDVEIMPDQDLPLEVF
jgi:2-keto-4-pentenoate hydratase/2-oxohepta-3-ene-1,7-dioic acid hydratase in catechol pathway